MNQATRIGIIGGGQLGMMLLEAAKEATPTVHYVVLEAQVACPARPFSDAFVLGSLQDPQALRRLADQCDILTWEIEHIHVDTLIELESEGKIVIPKPRVLKMIQDKGEQKAYFDVHGIPTAPYQLKSDADTWDLDFFSGERVVVKSRRGGYDGKGVAILTKAELTANGSPFSGPIVVEQFAENVKELAFIVAVDVHGRLETYPAIDMYFNPESNLVEFLYSPSMVSEEILLEAEAIAKKVVATFESPGLFAVEMFLTEDGEIWVNEIAPRPHNSGHHSIEGFQTSQFAQLNRILLGMELGPMGLRVPSAMINLVGPSDFSGTYQLEEAQFWESQTDVFVHLYGKTETRPDRKLGHVTVTASNLDGLMLRAREVQARMRITPS